MFRVILHASLPLQLSFQKKSEKKFIEVMITLHLFSLFLIPPYFCYLMTFIQSILNIVFLFIIFQKSSQVIQKMQSMVNRWKDKLTSMEQKQSIISNPGAYPPKPDSLLQNQSNLIGHTNAHINSSTITNSQGSIGMKKSLQKSKKSVNGYEQREKQRMSNSKRITTPSKKVQKNKKNKFMEKACQEIFEIFAKATPTDKTTSSKIRNTLQQLWNRCAQCCSQSINSPVEKINSYNNLQEQTSIMRESNISSNGISMRKQQKLYQQLEKKYFQIEKQKQYYKSKIDEMLRKYENVDKQLEQYQKMQKLIDKCIQRQQQMRQQNKILRNSLKQNQLKLLEQQKIFQTQIHVVRELVDEIKKNLPLNHS